MPNNKKPRKVMGKRPIRRSGGLFVIHKRNQDEKRKQFLTTDEVVKHSTAYHTAVDLMVAGQATLWNFDTLIHSTNVMCIIAEQMAPDLLLIILPSLDGLSRARKRFQDTGKIGLDGDALNALKAAADIHESLLEQCTAGELSDALEEAYRRVSVGHIFKGLKEPHTFVE
jgi:hypothetical protein